MYQLNLIKSVAGSDDKKCAEATKCKYENYLRDPKL